MATFDMTSKSTTGVNSSSIVANQANRGGQTMRMVEAILDMDTLTADGYSCADGDIFQLLEIPVNTFVLCVPILSFCAICFLRLFIG